MTGSLQVKGNRYYVVARMPDQNGKTKAKWISTGIETKGNTKREAKQAMQKILSKLEDQKVLYTHETNFVLWIDNWMDQKRLELRLNTWEGYKIYLEKHIRPYFEPRKLTLSKLTPQHIQDYYTLKLKEGLSISTIKKHNAIIHGALQEAFKKGILAFNPTDRVSLPRQTRQDKFKGSSYTTEQAIQLLAVLEDDVLKPAVVLGLY